MDGSVFDDVPEDVWRAHSNRREVLICMRGWSWDLGGFPVVGWYGWPFLWSVDTLYFSQEWADWGTTDFLACCAHEKWDAYISGPSHKVYLYIALL